MSQHQSNQWWIISAGKETERDNVWNEFKNSNTVGFYWNETGDLSKLTEEQIKEKFKQIGIEEEGKPKDWGPARDILKVKKNDILFVKLGKRGFYGIAKALATYQYNTNQSYHHTIPIQWITTQPYKTPDGYSPNLQLNNTMTIIPDKNQEPEIVKYYENAINGNYYIITQNPGSRYNDVEGKQYDYDSDKAHYKNFVEGTNCIVQSKIEDQYYFIGYGKIGTLEKQERTKDNGRKITDITAKYSQYTKFVKKKIRTDEINKKLLQIAFPNSGGNPQPPAMLKIPYSLYCEILGEDLTSKDNELDTMSMDNYDRALKWKPNLILYGPPGTGKTYHASKIAEKIISENLNIRYQNNDIQKMSDDEYLEFVISSLKQEAENNGYVMKQERQNIVLKKENHKIHLRITTSSSDTGDPVSCYCGIDDNTIDFLKKASENDRYIVTINHSQKNFVVLPYSIQQSNASFAGGDTWDLTGKTAHSYHIRIDENSIILSGTNYDCTKFMRNIQGIFQNNSIFKVTFHPSYSYEDFVEGFRPNTDKDSTSQYVLEKGIFWKACQKAKQYPNDKVALIIDEINRGNIPKILGELITLIEKDKRNTENSLKLTYSKDDFFVPENLIIIGTMNTADKSLMQMDDALKRRFVFEELMPDTDVLLEHLKEKNIVHAKNYSQILKRINEKILGKGNGNESERMKQFRDRQIGHSYFWDLANDDDLQTVMKYDIIPLLQDYFYGDYNEIRKILGKGFDGKDATIIGEDNRPTELVNDKSKNTQLKEKLLEI
ncbi:AAA family ATPase [Nitrosopumilus sp.]|nr:AAA family ATPase [Nitrosopumilus sp.]